MNRILSSRRVKAYLFVLCLIPVAILGYRVYANDLSANPVEFIEHYTGDWAIRLLLVTLCVTPLRKLTGWSQLSRFRRLLGLYTFFYAVLHFLTYLWFDQQFDPMAILGDISKRRYITVGFLSWVCMGALATTSTAGWVRRIGLKSWQRLHRLVYVSAAAAVIHYYWLVKSDIRLPAMYGGTLTILLVARAPWLWKKAQAGGFRVRLTKIHRETNDAVTLTFSLPSGKTLQSKPGQFLNFNWVVNGHTLPRSYSISSAPGRVGSFDVTVKKQGIVSTFLNESAREGLTVVANGPYGRFVFDLAEHRAPVFFAAGSGITPILSMLRTIEETSPERDATLFYASRDERQIIFKAELDRLEARLRKFCFVPIVTRPSAEWAGERGQLTEEMVLKTLPTVEDKTFFLCGPAGFMTAVSGILATLGAVAKQIHRERFMPGAVAYARRESVPCTVEFTRSRKRLVCNSTETLLSVAERNDIDIPASCRIGQCGTCATRVLAGEVEMESDEGLSPALRAEGFSLLCVGRARGIVSLEA
jgi:ferredoxin-NADP reductase/DMSO/TMAO reductase YedYZ heme-binding membrane subunit